LSTTPAPVTTADDATDTKAVEVAMSLPLPGPATAARIAQHIAGAREDLARRDAAQRPGAA
jgi:hypothetical protein